MTAQTKQQDVHIKRNTHVLHIETELGLINITLGLRDSDGRKIEHIQINADRYAGEPDVDVDLGEALGKATSIGFRLVRLTDDEQQARNHAAGNQPDPIETDTFAASQADQDFLNGPDGDSLEVAP